MKKNSTISTMSLFAVTIVILSTSCAPALRTHIQKSYPARHADAPVTVLELGQSSPFGAEVLGRVEVNGTNNLGNNTYEHVLALAKAQTNKVGGNALLLTNYKQPTTKNYYHQIGGNMLLLTTPTAPQAASQIEIEQQGNYVTQVAPQKDPKVTLYTPKSEIKTSAKGKKKPQFTIFANGGYSFITNDIIAADNARSKTRQGLDISAGANLLAHYGFGGGLRYSGYFNNIQYDGQDNQFRLHYISAEMIFRLRAGQRWLFTQYMGIGYVNHTESLPLKTTTGEFKSHAANGYGYHIGMGVEYKIARNIGIGIESTYYFSRFVSLFSIPIAPKGATASVMFNRLSLSGGVRFHF